MPVAVVTGASRGIGLATAHRLQRADYQVLNLSRTPVPGMATFLTDVSRPAQVAAAFDAIAAQYGPPDVLVNCAGMVEPRGLLEIRPAEWRRTLDVNLTGTFLCTQQFARQARGRGGKIINIASTAGTRAQPGWSAYAAAKAGVISFSLTMAEELRPYGIHVYCVAPGRCATELRRKLAPDENPETIMQPDEVAEFIHYLVTGGERLDGQVITLRGHGR